MVLALTAIMLGAATLPNSQHSAPFYKLCAAVFPVMLVMASVVGRGVGTQRSRRWRISA